MSFAWAARVGTRLLVDLSNRNGSVPPEKDLAPSLARIVFDKLLRVLARVHRSHPYETLSMITPKQPLAQKERDWYPYYAGFTESFVEEVIEAFASDASSVLDPWNGSGTTAATCIRNDVLAAGIDINPALTIIARARLTPRSVTPSLASLGSEILAVAERTERGPQSADLLSRWIIPKALLRVRSVQSAIHSVLTNLALPSDPFSIPRLADNLPILACFYYCVLFASVRDLLSRFRASNPTWLLSPRDPRHRIAPTWQALGAAFRRHLDYFSERLTIVEDNYPKAALGIRTACSTELPFESSTVSACVTSPPYATRIDYVQSMLPELALLGADSRYIAHLRRHSTGSPVVRDAPLRSNTPISLCGRSLLDQVANHPSKGSRRYYLPWLANYLGGLERGLIETSRVVLPGGPICVVVQDSHYKEVHIDLQRIVSETFQDSGRRLVGRHDFKVLHHRARMNPRARHHLLDRKNCESLLIFR